MSDSGEDSYCSSSESEGPQEPETWDDWEEGAGPGGSALNDEEQEPTRSLFEPAKKFPSPDACIEYDTKEHGFDLRSFKRALKLTDYDVIKLVNFVRSEVKSGKDPKLALAPTATERPWDDDQYLMPVFMDDPLMFFEFEDEDESTANPFSAAPVAAPTDLASEVLRLRAENEALRIALEELSAATLPAELLEELAGGGAATDRAPGEPSSSGSGPQASAPPEAQRVDDAYFDSYSHLGIHRSMLGDEVRTEAYRQALEGNPSLLGGKTVLDVGCGTGILSMFAARGGAVKVIGIDGSEKMAAIARENARTNGIENMEVIAGKVEELASLPVTHVDVIVSEWMGYALVFETMLPTVLHARDRWLAPGGAVLPDLAKILIAAGSEGATDLDFWNDVYGFQMSTLRAQSKAAALKRPLVRCVDAKDVLGPAVEIQCFDLMTMRASDQDFHADFALTADRGSAEVHSVVMWFDCLFSARFCKEKAVVLPTAPHGTQTHWAQTVLTLKEPVKLGEGEQLRGRISFCRATEKHRALDISLECWRGGTQGGEQERQAMLYRMEVEQDE